MVVGPIAVGRPLVVGGATGRGADGDVDGRALPCGGEGGGQGVGDRVADRQYPRRATGGAGHRGGQRCRRRRGRDRGGQRGGRDRGGCRGRGEGRRGRRRRGDLGRRRQRRGQRRRHRWRGDHCRGRPGRRRRLRGGQRGQEAPLVDRPQPGSGADRARDGGHHAARREDRQRRGPGSRHAAAQADGVLDRDVAGGRHADGERRDDGGGGPRAEMGPVLDGQQDRPVGEVDAVAQEPEHAQRPPPQDPTEPSAVVLAGPDDGQRAGQRHAEQRAPVDLRVPAVEGEGRPDEQGHPQRTRDVGHAPELGPGRPHPQRAQGGAEEQGRRPRVRAQVEAVDRRPGPRQPDRPGGEHDAARGRHGHQPPHAAASQRPPGHERPDQVELLLDRQAPDVGERAGLRERLPVARAPDDVEPVAAVGQRAPQVLADDRAGLGGGHERGEQPDAGQEEEQRRQQAAGPAPPEDLQRDAARAVVLGQQEAGDQVAREDEEGVDADPTAPQDTGVVEQHAEHRRPAQAIEGRAVRQPGPPIHPAQASVDERGSTPLRQHGPRSYCGCATGSPGRSAGRAGRGSSTTSTPGRAQRRRTRRS